MNFTWIFWTGIALIVAGLILIGISKLIELTPAYKRAKKKKMIPETITPEILNTIYFSQTMPTVIIASVASSLVFLFLGLIIVKKSRTKFLNIWGLSLLFSAIGITFLYVFPNFIQMILNTFKLIGA